MRSILVFACGLFIFCVLGCSSNTPVPIGSRNWVQGVYASADGSKIYAATQGGLSVSTNSGSTWTHYTIANGLGDNDVNGVFVNGSTIYAATAGGLSISADNGSTWTNQKIADGPVMGISVSGNTVCAIIGPESTFSGGLAVSISGGPWTIYSTADGLGSNYIDSVFVSGTNIYAATRGGLSYSANSGGSWANYTTSNGLGSNFVLGLCVVGGTVYAATAGGVSSGVVGGTLFTNPSTIGPAIDVSVSGSNIGVVTDAGLLVSTDGGVTLNNYTTANGLISNAINSVYVSGSNFYVATQQGLSVSTNSGATWTNYTTANGF